MSRFLVAMLWAALPAIAARPLTTEDASILEEKACQLEAWVDGGQGATQYWMVPACNFGASIEWQAGLAKTHSAGRTQFSEAYAQAKSAWPLGPAWSIGAVVGVTRRPLQALASGWDNPYAIIPMSASFGSTAVHVNAGWIKDREAARNAFTWGLAAERRISSRTTLLAEAFGENGARPYLRAGARYSAWADRLDLDLSMVTRAGGGQADRLISLGLLFQAGRFLP